MQVDFAIPETQLQRPLPERQQLVKTFATALQLPEPHWHSLEKARNFFGDEDDTHLIEPIGRLERDLYDLLDARALYEDLMHFFGIDRALWETRKSATPGQQFKQMFKAEVPEKITALTGDPLTLREWEELNDLLSQHLDIPPEAIEEIVVKANQVAQEQAKQDASIIKRITPLSALPHSIQTAVEAGTLTATQGRAVQFALQKAANNVQKTTTAGKTLIRNMIVDAMQQESNQNQHFAQQLFREMGIGATPESDEPGFLHRDWARVAVTELNQAAANGYLMGLAPGSLVMGISHDDACEYCLRLIDGQVYRVAKKAPPPMDSEVPGTPAYENLIQRWEKEVWVGKSNVGLSLAKRRRTAEGLVDREPHERAKPTLPLHPHGRCSWRAFNPETSYIDTNGEIQFLTPGEDLPADWYVFVQNQPVVQEELQRRVQEDALEYLTPDQVQMQGGNA